MQPEKPLGRLCFLNAPFNTEFLGYGGEPTSLLYALAVLVDEVKRKQINSIRLEDISVISFRSAAEMDLAALQKRIKAYPPKIFGVSNMTPSSETARRIVEHVKAANPDVITIFGGPHEDELAESHPRLGDELGTKPTSLTHPHLADFSVSGDGEYALSFLVKEIETCGAKSNVDDIKQQVLADQSQVNRLPGIGSIFFRHAGEEYRLKLSGCPLNLNDLPFMPRELLDDNHSRSFSIFRGSGRNLRTAQVMTSRGCFWTCAFCTEATGKTFQRTFENVRNEIDQLRDLDYEAIFFDDSTFTNLVESKGAPRREFLNELLEYLRETRWNWGCETRIDQVNEAVLRQLKDAGCSYIYFGVESVNDGILRDMHKGQRRNRVQHTLDAIEKVDLRVGLSLMFCAPNMERNQTNESRETFEDTITFFKERVARGNICNISTNIATYYPGSEMTQRAIASGMQIDFSHPTPNTGYPWTRFEDGQGYHPPNVSRCFVEDIANLTARRLAPYLLKGNIAAIQDERLAESLYRRNVINLNFPIEFSRSEASSYVLPSSVDSITPSSADSFQKARILLGGLCGLAPNDAVESVVLTRTCDEAVAFALAAAGYYAGPFRAIVPDIDLATVAAPFQFVGDHGDVCGEGVRSKALVSIGVRSLDKPRMPRRKTDANVFLLDPFTDAYELLERIRRLLTDSRDVVLLPHVEPSTGRILDVRRVCAQLRDEKGGDDLLIIVDGRFADGVLSNRSALEDIDCDYYVMSPSESLGLVGCCGLAIGSRQRSRAITGLHEWIPVAAGMLPDGMERDSCLTGSFPNVLVESLINGFNRITSSCPDVATLGELNARKRALKRRLADLLSKHFEVKILSGHDGLHVSGILAVHFRDIDQFGLVEHLWREQQVLASYFCAQNLVRFAVDFSTTEADIEEAVDRLRTIVPRFHL
jgi:radical SAM superfamily enzyme YgiQ (UPF0313 family)